ncbi:MAG TPA: ABC transporter permease [Phycisphaerae bacterium]|nr:ABC transporter permease [Phycisphaerae bacterium]
MATTHETTGVGSAPHSSFIIHHSSFPLWPVLCVLAVVTILAGYLALIISNALYLGWSDLTSFLPRERLWVRFWLTVRTSTVATLASLIVGIPAGYALSRLKLPCRTLVSTLIDLPVMVPPAAVGVFLFGIVKAFPVRQFTELTGIRFAHNPNGIVLVQFAVTVAFCARLMKASFDGVNPRFEQVSRSLGASLPATLWHVTLPLAKNGVIASSIVVWARAAAEWEGLMLFVGGTMAKTDVMPFSVYLDWNGGMMGWVVTFSLVCVALAVISMAAVRTIGGRSYVW